MPTPYEHAIEIADHIDMVDESPRELVKQLNTAGLLDRVGREWQTKELDNTLRVWRLGDTIDSEHIPKRGTVNVRVYDYDEQKKRLVYATVKVVNGIVKSIKPDREQQ